MTSTTGPARGQRVVAVTGGGGGIGAAIAQELGRQGAFVVTMDPLVSLDGTEQLPHPQETTAGSIVAAGGSARATSVSVIDAQGVADLFGELGRLDAVINVAGITRPTSFAKGAEEEWASVLAVHLGGYLNVLAAALPMMAAAGHGRILGVTSGSGWRSADAGAYGCAKRAVASLTWQLGRVAPPGVVVNAISPIAVTRMVSAALAKASASSRGPRSSSTGGLSLGSMPAPEELGPLGAHLVGEGFSWCNGRVLFAAGSELAVIDEPRLIEVLRTDDAGSLPQVLEAFGGGALAPAERAQVSGGGSNPRFSTIFGGSGPGDLPAPAVRSCAVVADSPDIGVAVAAALEARGVACTSIRAEEVAPGFAGASRALSAAVGRAGPIDAVVVASGGGAPAAAATTGWEQVLAEHADILEHIRFDAGWARAVADHAVSADVPVRLVTVTDASTAGGQSRAQAAAQLARAGRRATGDRVSAFAVGLEAPPSRVAPAAGELVAHLVCSPGAPELSGAELVAGPGWIGLRSHPRPGGSITYGGPGVPHWLDDALRGIVGEEVAR